MMTDDSNRELAGAVNPPAPMDTRDGLEPVVWQFARYDGQWFNCDRAPTPEQLAEKPHLFRPLYASSHPSPELPAGGREALKQILVQMVQRQSDKLIVIDYETTLDRILAALPARAPHAPRETSEHNRFNPEMEYPGTYGETEPSCHGPDDAFCMVCNPPTERLSEHNKFNPETEYPGSYGAVAGSLCPDCGRAVDGPTHAAYCAVAGTECCTMCGGTVKHRGGCINGPAVSRPQRSPAEKIDGHQS